MKLFKKATATLALVTLVSGFFATGVSASSSTEIEAANALAEAGYIVDHSDSSAAYNLNQNVLRQEIAAVARGIAGLDKKETCDNSFADVSATKPNTWACYSVEALLDAGLIAKNTNFNPEKNISKAEAVGMMVKAAFGDEYAYDSSKGTSWQEQVVEFAASKGVVASFTNYDTPATRGFVFESGYNAMVATEEVVDECDEVSQLLGLCDETTDDTTDDETTDTGSVVSGDNVLMAELSAETPEGSDLPKSANGVDVLKFDVTAGSEDVSISAMEFERIGFGESAADELAVYTEEGRASKVKSFNSSDDSANVTFSPAVVVKAGETRTLTVKVNTDDTNIGEFAVSVKSITATSTVDAGSIVSNYFDVKSVTAAELTFSDEGVNASVKAGEEQADLMEFKLKNEGNLSTDADITVSSVTLKEIGSIDQENSLENITLTVDNVVIDTVETMTDKYVTFNFDPIVIGDDKNKTFTVKADIIGGAGEKVQFSLENPIDVTAVSSKYNAVNIQPAAGVSGTLIAVDAGELTLYSIDATSDEIRSDKDNVTLGQLKIVNIAGKNLELKNLGVYLEAVSGSATSNTGILNNIENVEVELNGTSYDLSSSIDSNVAIAATTTNNVKKGLFKESDLDIILPQGTSILTVRADTLKNLSDDTTIKMTMDGDPSNDKSYSNFRVEETDDDEVVTDVTPDTLSWDEVSVVNSSTSIANVPLANVSVVKGASDVVALQFELEAGSASSISSDKIKVKLTSTSGATTSDATKDQISEVVLYKGSVSDSNVLDRVSGSKLAAGVATFDGFNVDVAADATQTFVVTISTVDTTEVNGKVLKAFINNPSTDIELEDDENDTITLSTTTPIGSKAITVSDSGKLKLTADANNDDNEDPKTILAGEEATVYSIDAISTNEDVKVETVKFNISGTLSATGSSMKSVIASAKLYLGDKVVATASNSDVIGGQTTAGNQSATGTITFDDISDLEIPTTSSELRLAIDTETIGYEKIGTAVSSFQVTSMDIADAKGSDSNEDVTVAAGTLTLPAGSYASNVSSIVPAKLTLSLVKNLSQGTAKVKITATTGDNTADASAAAPVITLKGLTVNNKATGGALKIFEENSSTVADFTGGIIISSSKTFEIVPQVTSAGNSYTLSIPTNGVLYNVESTTGLTTNMVDELDLGTISYN